MGPYRFARGTASERFSIERSAADWDAAFRRATGSPPA